MQPLCGEPWSLDKNGVYCWLANGARLWGASLARPLTRYLEKVIQMNSLKNQTKSEAIIPLKLQHCVCVTLNVHSSILCYPDFKEKLWTSTAVPEIRPVALSGSPEDLRLPSERKSGVYCYVLIFVEKTDLSILWIKIENRRIFSKITNSNVQAVHSIFSRYDSWFRLVCAHLNLPVVLSGTARKSPNARPLDWIFGLGCLTLTSTWSRSPYVSISLCCSFWKKKQFNIQHRVYIE